MSGNDRRVKLGASGPRAQKSTSGTGGSFSLFSLVGQAFGHKREVRGPNAEFNAVATRNELRLSAQANLADISHTTPGGSSASLSVGVGGEVGIRNDPVSKRTTFTVAPFGKGKTGASFSASHASMASFGEALKKTSDPSW